MLSPDEELVSKNTDLGIYKFCPFLVFYSFFRLYITQRNLTVIILGMFISKGLFLISFRSIPFRLVLQNTVNPLLHVCYKLGIAAQARLQSTPSLKTE